MRLPPHKTRIVCTIGPACEAPEMMERMVEAGMSVARLNFSHGTFDQHAAVIENLRRTARKTGRRIAILGDLPGPKMRIGRLAEEPVELDPSDEITLTTERVTGDATRVSVTFSGLPAAVKPGDVLFLNDGLIQLEVVRVSAVEVACRVIVGGELRSRKGLNLPGIQLGIRAFTPHDHECLRFAVEHGVDAVSQSFVESAEDIEAVRRAAAELGKSPFIIAKIERSGALDRLGEIIAAADGIMIARGDLGVEVPIERIAMVQKEIIRQANLHAKPVITATQMLESMTANRRPTRAEATDVANAILDGTDCVMLSEESAMGSYPVEAVSMLGRIAQTVESYHRSTPAAASLPERDNEHAGRFAPAHLIAVAVDGILAHSHPAAIFVPTKSGATARSIARFRLPVWTIAVSRHEATCQALQFSRGVYPVHEREHPEDWKEYVKRWMREHNLEGELVVATEGPSSNHPEANHRIEIIDLVT